MVNRPVMLAGMLGAAVAAPIAIHEGPKHFSFMGGGGGGAAPTEVSPELALINPSLNGGIAATPIEGPGFATLAEVLRMDITEEWVYARWPRKSTGLADPTLFGVRVPVVTGTRLIDLAGSISYYFNEQGRVDKLRFHGRTADTTQLVAVVQSQFGLRPQAAPPGEQLYQSRSSRGVVGQLRTRVEPLLMSSSPHESFAVDLELNRPGAGRFVQPERLRPNIPPPRAPIEPQYTAAQPAPPTQTAPAAERPASPAPQPSSTQQAAGDATDGSGSAGDKAGSGSRKGLLDRLLDAERPGFRWPN